MSLAATASLPAGCSPLGVVNALVPRTGYRLEGDLAYGANARQRLDWYESASPCGPQAPLVVFFYGGNWTEGDRRDDRFVGDVRSRRPLAPQRRTLLRLALRGDRTKIAKRVSVQRFVPAMHTGNWRDSAM